MSRKKKKDDQIQQETGSVVKRREFIKGAGAAAAIGSLSANKAKATGTGGGPMQGRSPVLDGSPLVNIWRHGSKMETTTAFVDKVLGWPKLGEIAPVAMYDAGSVIIGFFIPETEQKRVGSADDSASSDTQKGGPSADSVQTSVRAALPTCSAKDLEPANFSANNLASDILILPDELKLDVIRPEGRMAFVAAVKAEAGTILPVLDNDGNLFSYYNPSQSVLSSTSGERIRGIKKKFSAQGRQSSNQTTSPVVSISLMASNFERSTRFYRDTLGLRTLGPRGSEARFDVGSLVLAIKPEPATGLVNLLNRSGRLRGDTFAFHTKDIKGTMQTLQRRGVDFPYGIESSATGDVAYFSDPDGYHLGLWQPSGKHKGIDFYPALNRILKDAGAA